MSAAEAARKLTRYAHRHGRVALEFAAHAALPVALDPTLVNLIRVNFFSDAPRALPYSAEADLLLSNLCEDVGDDLFEMRPDVRAALLSVLDRDFSRDRARELALLLWRHGERHSAWAHHTLLRRAQEVTALGFLSPERARQWLDMAVFDTVAFPEADEAWFLAMSHEVSRATDMRAARVVPVVMSAAPRASNAAHPWVDRELALRWVRVRDDGRPTLAPSEREALRGLGVALAREGWSLALGEGAAAIEAVADAYLHAMVNGGVLRAGGLRLQGDPTAGAAAAATLALGACEASGDAFVATALTREAMEEALRALAAI